MLRSLALLAGLAILAAPLAAKDYFVSAISGSDQNAGTAAAPFKTLSHAAGQLANGDRLFVLPGRYCPSNGDTFPIQIRDGVKVLGQDPRSCVIDAEFDTTLPNLKNNVVQGLMLQLGSNSTLSSVSIVNGPRNPKKQDDYWWAIALRVEGSSGHALGTVVDRVIVDRVSRGIFWGFAVGDHDIRDNVIRNCVVSRFYVEAINGTPGAGTCSGNRIYNCTLVGHVDPTTKKPLGRANLSFGPGMQADVRNCVIGGSDWVGIEADAQKAKITSDHNCFFSLGGFFQDTRGPAKGPNDVSKDPMLGTMPTMTTPLDPHHAGPPSPLFRGGVNQANQQSESDIDGALRVFGGTVDIGADEYQGVDGYFFGTPQTGTNVHFGAVGSANGATVFLLGFGQMTGLPIPGFRGRLHLDIALPILPVAAINGANGAAMAPLPLPKGVAFQGFQLYLQSLDVATQTFSDLDFLATTN